MIVVPPLTVTNAILTSSTCAEPHASENAYNALTTYAKGDEVVVASEHLTYVSLIDGNVGNTPNASPDAWLASGPTMRWKMFDLDRDTQTVDASPLTVVLTPGKRINALALFGIDATTVTIDITSVTGGGNVYHKVVNVRKRICSGWYDWFFKPFGATPSLALFDLPAYLDKVITLTFTRAGGGAVSCGGVVIGRQIYLGDAQFNAVSSGLNFSTFDRDTYGYAILVRRRSVPKTNQQLFAKKIYTNQIREAKQQLDAVPAAWFAVEDSSDGYFEAMLVLGVWKTFDLDVADTDRVVTTLEIEGF